MIWRGGEEAPIGWSMASRFSALQTPAGKQPRHYRRFLEQLTQFFFKETART